MGRFYERNIRAYEILAGEVSPPEECQALYQVMKEHQELAARAALKLAKQQAAKHADRARDRFVDSTGLSLPVSTQGDVVCFDRGVSAETSADGAVCRAVDK